MSFQIGIKIGTLVVRLFQYIDQLERDSCFASRFSRTVARIPFRTAFPANFAPIFATNPQNPKSKVQ